MFDKIVVAVDGSEGSSKALAKAADIQKVSGGNLYILTIFRHHSLLESSMSMVRPDDPMNMDDVMRDHARQVAEEAKQLATSLGATNVRSFAKAGQPARSIVKFADEHAADLIVVGSRGIGDVDGFLLGSVSHKVTGLAKCPVLVV
jgi:nucleotide-binding universal stress UspA family protein